MNFGLNFLLGYVSAILGNLVIIEDSFSLLETLFYIHLLSLSIISLFSGLETSMPKCLLINSLIQDTYEYVFKLSYSNSYSNNFNSEIALET